MGVLPKVWTITVAVRGLGQTRVVIAAHQKDVCAVLGVAPRRMAFHGAESHDDADRAAADAQPGVPLAVVDGCYRPVVLHADGRRSLAQVDA